jgi:hypothetical protein
VTGLQTGNSQACVQVTTSSLPGHGLVMPGLHMPWPRHGPGCQEPFVSLQVGVCVPQLPHSGRGFASFEHIFFSPMQPPYMHVFGLQVLVPPLPHVMVDVPLHSLGSLHVPAMTIHSPVFILHVVICVPRLHSPHFVGF